MNCLTIQLDLSRDRSREFDAFLAHVRSAGRYPEIDQPAPNRDELALHFFTEDLSTLWPELQSTLLADSEFGVWLKNVAIIGCDGAGSDGAGAEQKGHESDSGQDKSDFRLLYHYDASEHCDGLGVKL